ncbi:YibE/F family protein [Patescibacteria group bacterium]|nr:YibE/F family protein [Patescibacteria group bacterium]
MIGSQKFFGILLLVGVFVMLSGGVVGAQEINGEEDTKLEFYKAEVVGVEDLAKEETEGSEFNDWQKIKVIITSVQKKGEEFEFEHESSVFEKNDRYLKAGSKIVVSYQQVDGANKVAMVDYDRSTQLLVMAALFVLILLGVGLWLGVRAIFGFVWIAVILAWFLIPRIVQGVSPIWIITISALLIVVVVAVILVGFTKKALLVVLSSVFGLLVAAVLIIVFAKWAGFSQIGVEESHLFHISPVLSKLNLVDILLGGMIIGALGSMMDISISIVAGIDELIKTNRERGTRTLEKDDLYKSGLSIGREIMAVNANTLLLAYAGSAMTIWIVAISQGYSWTVLISFNMIFAEILRIWGGTMGIFAAIPVTAWLASRLLTFHRKMAYEENEQ